MGILGMCVCGGGGGGVGVGGGAKGVESDRVKI